MITEPFEPVTETKAMGYPHHGFAVAERIGATYVRWLVTSDGVWHPHPAWLSFPEKSRYCYPMWSKNGKVDLTPEELAAELAEGRTWIPMAVGSGGSNENIFYGTNIGVLDWFYVDPLENVWGVSIQPSAHNVAERPLVTLSRDAFGARTRLTESGYYPKFQGDGVTFSFRHPTMVSSYNALGAVIGEVACRTLTRRGPVSLDALPVDWANPPSGEIAVTSMPDYRYVPAMFPLVNYPPYPTETSLLTWSNGLTDFTLSMDAISSQLMTGTPELLIPRTGTTTFVNNEGAVETFYTNALEGPLIAVYTVIQRFLYGCGDDGDTPVIWTLETKYTTTLTMSGEVYLQAPGSPAGSVASVPPHSFAWATTVESTLTTPEFQTKAVTAGASGEWSSSWKFDITGGAISGSPADAPYVMFGVDAGRMLRLKLANDANVHTALLQVRIHAKAQDGPLAMFDESYNPWTSTPEGTAQQIRPYPRALGGNPGAEVTDTVLIRPMMVNPNARVKPPAGLYLGGRKISDYVPVPTELFAVNPFTHEVFVLPRASTGGDGYVQLSYV